MQSCSKCSVGRACLEVQRVQSSRESTKTSNISPLIVCRSTRTVRFAYTRDMPMSRSDFCAEVLASCVDNVHPVGVLSAVGGVAPAAALAGAPRRSPTPSALDPSAVLGDRQRLTSQRVTGCPPHCPNSFPCPLMFIDHSSDRWCTSKPLLPAAAT